MSILSDHSLRIRLATQSSERLVIETPGPDAVQPNSIDLRLGPVIEVPHQNQSVRPLTNEYPDAGTAVSIQDEPFLLMPNRSVLAVVAEFIKMPPDRMGLLTVKSTYARVFLHQPASVVDAGYEGKLTLELTNLGPHDIWLDAGIDIAQLLVFRMTSAADVLYGHPSLRSRYQSDRFPKSAQPKQTAASREAGK